MIKPPCYQCADRQDGCHSVCKAYIAFAEERKAFLAEQHRQKQLKQDLYALSIHRREVWKNIAKEKHKKKMDNIQGTQANLYKR